MSVSLLAVATAALVLPVAQPTDATYHQGDVGARIVEAVEAAGADGLNGAVLAARDGEVIAAVGVGFADLDRTIRNTPDSHFEIASVTKQFTGAAVVHLAEQGALTLDDPIARHLPGVPEDCSAITVRHLLQHTSGIPGSNSQGGGDDLGRVLPAFLSGGPRRPPGTSFEYWNQGYALLSEIVARASGSTYTEYCKTNLFEPAGMNATGFTGDGAPDDAVVAVGRSRFGPARSAYEHPYGSYGFQYRGMGGAVTTVWDLWKWDRALHENTVLSPASTATMFSPGLDDYALGWKVTCAANGRLVQSHAGSVRGFVSEIRRYPLDNACLFVLCNGDDAPLRTTIDALESILFEEQAAANMDAAFVSRLVGEFEQKERGVVLKIRNDAGNAAADIHWSPRGPITNAKLRFNEEGEFVLDDGSSQHVVTVEPNEGPVTKVTISVGRSAMSFDRTE